MHLLLCIYSEATWIVDVVPSTTNLSNTADFLGLHTDSGALTEPPTVRCGNSYSVNVLIQKFNYMHIIR